MDLHELFAVEPLSWLGILAAILSGTIVGIERQVLGKPVGIRTSSLICLGTYVFTVIGESFTGPGADPSRVVGQIITGIGFLGAGVILTRDGIVLGVTSAAAVWILAGIGVVIGSGYEATGIKLAVLAVIILVGVDVVENSFKSLRRGVHANIDSLRRRATDMKPHDPDPKLDSINESPKPEERRRPR
ncbi:MAG: MgtC/SapB family protein [Hahellaceae bacterium]|nr:MgtC/SapB family protein [Hahellaceae bacterium]